MFVQSLSIVAAREMGEGRRKKTVNDTMNIFNNVINAVSMGREDMMGKMKCLWFRQCLFGQHKIALVRFRALSRV